MCPRASLKAEFRARAEYHGNQRDEQMGHPQPGRKDYSPGVVGMREDRAEGLEIGGVSDTTQGTDLSQG